MPEDSDVNLIPSSVGLGSLNQKSCPPDESRLSTASPQSDSFIPNEPEPPIVQQLPSYPLLTIGSVSGTSGSQQPSVSVLPSATAHCFSSPPLEKPAAF